MPYYAIDVRYSMPRVFATAVERDAWVAAHPTAEAVEKSQIDPELVAQDTLMLTKKPASL